MGSAFRFSALPGPAAYERYYLPRLFLPWAAPLLDLASVSPGDRVLDVATGPGTVARLAAARVAPGGYVLGTDLSPAMLALARAKPAVEGAPLAYVRAWADPLPVATAIFDVALCQQALQFFRDRLAALVEMRRALAPSGRAAIAIWGPLADCEHFAAVDATIDDAGMPADWHVGMRAPFAGIAPGDLSALLHAAGFRAVRVESQVLPFCFEGGLEQAIESLSVTPLAAALDVATEAQRERFLDALRLRLARFVEPRGVVTRMKALLAVADH